MQWTDFNNLTPAQRTKLAEFAVVGLALGGTKPNTNPNITGLTYSQAKQSLAFGKEVQSLVGPAVLGARFVYDKLRNQALTDFDTANP